MSASQAVAPNVTLTCKPEKSGNALVFTYLMTNEGPGDIYISEAFPRVDPATHRASADRDLVAITLEPDAFVQILRGRPKPPPFPVAVPVRPLMARLHAGDSAERRLTVPLPLAESSPYQPYGNVRDYTLAPIKGIVLAVDWILPSAEGFVANPVAYADGLVDIYSANIVRDMRRASCRLPTHGLSILHRTPK
jgi:hypothetical protein